jgi:hypothetical protein
MQGAKKEEDKFTSNKLTTDDIPSIRSSIS